jgi:hypothetical protein
MVAATPNSTAAASTSWPARSSLRDRHHDQPGCLGSAGRRRTVVPQQHARHTRRSDADRGRVSYVNKLTAFETAADGSNARTSSGSNCSARDVKPTRSANNADTTCVLQRPAARSPPDRTTLRAELPPAGSCGRMTDKHSPASLRLARAFTARPRDTRQSRSHSRAVTGSHKSERRMPVLDGPCLVIDIELTSAQNGGSGRWVQSHCGHRS